MAQYNLRNPAVKRLMREAAELNSPTEEYFAQPLEDNLFEWHFTLRGPPNTEFEEGIYHGRITLPPEYPMKPPSIILLTPNGRFETNKKICLSISGHHPETWRPSWSIRTALVAMIGFMPTHGNGAIGSLDYTPEERKHLARKSQSWKCSECGPIRNALKLDDKKSSETSPLSESQMEAKVTTSHENGEIPLVQDSLTTFSENVAEGQSSHFKSPQNLKVSSSEKESVPRLRNMASSEIKDTSNNLPVERRKRSDYCALLFMWVIAFVLFILIARRLFFQ